MNGNYLLSPRALQDIDEIQATIEDLEDDHTADRFVATLYDTFSEVASRPDGGSDWPELTGQDVFFWMGLPLHTVIYRKASPIEIVRVLPLRKMEEFVLTILDQDGR